MPVLVRRALYVLAALAVLVVCAVVALRVAMPKQLAVTDTPAPRLGTLAPGTGIPVGQKVPEARLRDLEGKEVMLSSLYTKQPILLVFYRGGWCPFCNTQIHQLSMTYPEYRKRGLEVVAVSVDVPEVEARLKATYSIPFPVLSDSDAAVIEAFHVVNTVPNSEITIHKVIGSDLEDFSGQKHHKIAVPALFLIDTTGTVRWAHSDPDFQVRPSTAQVLAAIDGAGLR
jgi:peroxiredoxin